jgi:transposase InsO family protein
MTEMDHVMEAADPNRIQRMPEDDDDDDEEGDEDPQHQGRLNRILSELYYDPSNEGSYGGVNRLWMSARKQPGLESITQEQVKRFLVDQHSYSLHKPARRNFKRNKTYVAGIDRQWQADLADMQDASKDNDGFRYLLTVVDVFSKFAWVIPIKDKSAHSLVQAFKALFTASDPRRPLKLQTDKGTEFLNAPVKRLLSSLNVHLFASNSDKKAAVVERFNRTLKTRIFHFFTHRRTYRYIDVLQRLVDSYNNSVHRSIGMAPSRVRIQDEDRIWVKLYGSGGLAPANSSKGIRDGRMVRVSKVKGIFEKGYLPNWSEEHFTVDSSAKHPRKVYKLKDDSGETVHGSWYPEELQPIEKNKYYIEKVLRTRSAKGRHRKGTAAKKELLVKWKGWPAKFNSWIPESDVYRE